MLQPATAAESKIPRAIRFIGVVLLRAYNVAELCALTGSDHPGAVFFHVVSWRLLVTNYLHKGSAGTLAAPRAALLLRRLSVAAGARACQLGVAA